MIGFNEILLGVVAPAAMSAGLMLAIARLPILDRRFAAALAWVLALAVGLAWAFVAARGWPTLPPRVGAQWLVVATLPLAAILTLAQHRLRWSSWHSATLLTRTLLLAGTLWLLLGSYVRHHWARPEAVAWITGLTLLGMALWQWHDALARRSHRPRSLLAMALTQLALGVTIMCSGSLVDGQFALAAGVVALATLIASRTLLVQTAHGAAVGLMWLTLLATGIFGFFYAEVTPLSAGLTLASAALAGLTVWPWMTRSRPRRILAQALALLPALIAAGWAAWHAWQDVRDTPSWVSAWLWLG